MHWTALLLSILLGVGDSTFPQLGNVLPDIPNPVNATISRLGSVFSEVPNPLNILFQNKCIEDLGCFYTGCPFYHPINRPISLAPTDDLKTRFLLFTPLSPQEEQEITYTVESLNNSTFDPELQTKVLIHGYRIDLDVDDIRFRMKDALLNQSDCNIIVVDWTENNGPPYPQAVANARAVGAQVAKLLNLLMAETGITAGSIHVIGHSLGGHIAGWAGERIANLGRITGLDPAGPSFQSAPNEVRLDTTDADFVDVIHSNGVDIVADGWGIAQPLGHLDFYPNGGRRQPGCVFTSQRDNVVGSVVNATTDALATITTGCDHARANFYFVESILRSNCTFLAVQCDNYEDFENGECLPTNSTVTEMGFFSRKLPNITEEAKFYLRTNGESPFCRGDSIDLEITEE